MSLESDFVLYTGKDSPGRDYQYIPNKSLDELIELAKNPLCIAFNTNGYFKFAIQKESEWVDNPNINLYVHRERLNQLVNVDKNETDIVFPIPKLFHFIWFAGGRPFNMIHYLSIKSAYSLHPGYVLKLHCDAPPPADNFWFQKIKPFITINIITPTKELNGHPIQHFQHMADIIRLDVLYQEGGIYADIDNLFLKSIDNFRYIREGLLLSYDRPQKQSVGNHLILSTPKHRIIWEWRQIYETSWGTDMTAYWFGHSTIIPYELSLKYPHLMHKQDSIYFCPFLWNEFKIFQSEEDLHEKVHSIQLFETELSKYNIVQHDIFYFYANHNRFTILFKKYVEELPEWKKLLKLLREWEFHSKMDSPGNDIVHAPKKYVIDLLCEAENKPNCIAFNSWGWFKNNISPQEQWVTIKQFKTLDGLFIKKNNNGNGNGKDGNDSDGEDSEDMENVSLEMFEFHPKLDSVGNNIGYEPNMTTEELMRLCHKIPDCVGFNTLGFLKGKINHDLNPTKYFSDDDGLYTYTDRIEKPNRDKEISVKIVGNWANPKFLMNYHSRMLKNQKRWNNLVLTDKPTADYYAIMNYCNKAEYDPSLSIVFQMEPMRLNKPGNYGIKSWGQWANPNRSQFLQVRDHAFSPNNSEWHLAKTYNQLLNEVIQKSDEGLTAVSAVTSDKKLDDGHILRINFLKYIEQKHQNTEKPFSLDIWGKCSSIGFKNYLGELPDHNKVNGLYPYKYTIAVENNSEHNYFTEKINDAILSECLCFYWGCPNLEEYFEDAFIRLELNDFEHDYQIMVNAIQNHEWEKRLGAIRTAKSKILNNLQIMPTLDKIIQVHMGPPLMDTYFDKIFIINLKKCYNRWLKIEKYLQDAGITNYERFDAVDTQKSEEYNWPVPMAHKNRPNINYRAQLACKLSHWEVVKLAKARGYKRILVLEDDVILESQQIHKSNLALRELIDNRTEWDLLWLHCAYHKLGDRCGNYIWKLNYSVSMASYAVSKSCYDRVLEIIEKNMNYPIDDIYCKFIHPNMNSYCINPNLFSHDDNLFSNITNCQIFDKIKSICINLERRPDRMANMVKLFKHSAVDKYEFYKAIDGKTLSPSEDLKYLFRNNDFGYRRGVIGCALSHYGLWQQLIDDTTCDYYMIYEDDIQLADNFKDLYMTAITNMSKLPWDMICLGQHPITPKLNDKYRDYTKPLTLEILDKKDTIGGAFGYLINKKGASKLIAYIKYNGIRHGIDYIMMRMDLLSVYETVPHIVTSQYVSTSTDGVDSDIQRSYERLF